MHFVSSWRWAIYGLWLSVGAVTGAGQNIEVGTPKANVIALLGEPQGVMNVGDRQSLVYDGGVVEIKDGRVVYIDPRFLEKTWQKKKARAYEAEQAAQGLVLYDGAWISPAEKERREAQRRKLDEERRRREEEFRVRQEAREKELNEARAKFIEESAGIMHVSDGGKVDHRSLLESGKITVIYFVVPANDNCKNAGLRLHEYAAANPDVQLRRIEFPDLTSAVAKRYGVGFVPNIRVFSRNGLLVAPPQFSYEGALRAIERAK